MNFRNLLALATASLSLAACGGGDDFDDTIGGTAIVSITALPATPGGDLAIDEAWVALEWLELTPCTNDVGAIGVGKLPADLLHDPPLHGEFGTGVLDYCGMRLAVRPSDSRTELDGFSAIVRGTRADGAPVVIESVVQNDIAITGPSFNASRVVLGFDLDGWLAAVDVDVAALDDEGVARIDEGHNTDLLAVFEAALASAPAVYQDYDHDGHVGEDELTPVATPE